jgi:hypothetical protein
VQTHSRELALHEEAGKSEGKGGCEVETRRIHLERDVQDGEDGEDSERRHDDASILLPAVADDPGAACLVHLERQPPGAGENDAKDRVGGSETADLTIGGSSETNDLRRAKRQRQHDEVTHEERASVSSTRVNDSADRTFVGNVDRPMRHLGPRQGNLGHATHY